MGRANDLLERSDGRNEEVFSTLAKDEIGQRGLSGLLVGEDADHLAFETASGGSLTDEGVKAGGDSRTVGVLLGREGGGVYPCCDYC